MFLFIFWSSFFFFFLLLASLVDDNQVTQGYQCSLGFLFLLNKVFSITERYMSFFFFNFNCKPSETPLSIIFCGLFFFLLASTVLDNISRPQLVANDDNHVSRVQGSN